MTMIFPLSLLLRPVFQLLVSFFALLFCGAVQADIPYKFDGLDKTLETNTRAHIGIISNSEWDLRQRLKKRIISNTESSLQALGYYEPLITVHFNEKNKTLTVQVDKGKAVLWQAALVNLHHEGETDPELLRAVLKSSPKVNSTLNHDDYKKMKKQLKQELTARGYFDYKIAQSRLEIDRKAYQAKAIFSVMTGHRYEFGNVSFSKSKIQEVTLYKMVNFEAGQLFLKSTMDEFYKNLLSTGYFSNINIKNQLVKDGVKKVNFNVSLTDRKPNRINLGAGFGTDTGPRVKLSWDKPLLNSYGHSFLSTLNISEIQKALKLSYKIPYGHPVDDFYLFEAGWRNEQFERNEYTSRSIGLSQQYKLNNGWVRNLFVNLNSERSQQENQANQTTTLEDSFFVIPGISLTRRVSNHPLNPDRGYSLSFDFEFSDPVFSSDTRFGRFRGKVKGLQSWSKHALLGRMELGYLSSDDFSEVPLSTRFFTGGDQSIRGYDYNSLSPLSQDGTLIGGDKLAVASTEYLWRFKQKWKLALFIDHGTIGLDAQSLTYTGAGVGIRWISVVGNIQLDLASRIDSDESGLRVHLFMGPIL